MQTFPELKLATAEQLMVLVQSLITVAFTKETMVYSQMEHAITPTTKTPKPKPLQPLLQPKLHLPLQQELFPFQHKKKKHTKLINKNKLILQQSQTKKNKSICNMNKLIQHFS